jgi:isoleucyl-tRNA synthetase
VTIQGPNGPVTDSVEMMVGRLGLPEIGGSYFTFSNENNDLIWGFLAECNRRGWLYKGHDSMPWCTRCGTGISQMEMNEGYQDREDPGLTVRFPLVDRDGEWLLVWTTTPWTLAANVAAAVGPDLDYVKVRQGDDVYWLAKGTLKTALRGAFEVLEEHKGSDLVGWRYRGPYDELPAVATAFAGGSGDDGGTGYQHRVVAWDEVGEDEGTGIVHIAPGAGAEDYQLGKALGLPVIAPLDEFGHYLPGFGYLSGLDAHAVAERVVEDLEQKGVFYHLEPYSHRYPHCWRCGTPLLFRVVDEWYISMGQVYDKPRAEVTPAEKERSLRYQIMDVVDRVNWIPGFGYERELDWLINMADWMISKKRYWGLALPIWECQSCGGFDVMSGRDELKQRAVAGWEEFEGHTPHRPFVDAVKVACSRCGAETTRIADVGNPWLDAGIVPFSTMHYRTEPEYWQKWFPADFVTESFPGQFRNWFYSMLAMSTVLRCEAPFKTLLGYATLFGEDGRAMHKSWGNSIEFNEGAERIGVDVMRWMFAKARTEDNILFGYKTADEARRELLVLWNVFAFFMTYARLHAWRPAADRAASRSTETLDRWILSRTAAAAQETERELADFDSRGAAIRLGQHIDELSTWYLRRSRRRISRNPDTSDQQAAFATLHAALVGIARMLAPILPFLSEYIYQQLVTAVQTDAPDSVHLTRWPAGDFRDYRDEPLEAAMAMAMRAVDLGRTLRSQAGINLRQPIRQVWLALPPGSDVPADVVAILAEELNAKRVELMSDESDLIERRVRPLLPKIGKRLGGRTQDVLAAARNNEVEYLPDGSVRLAGVDLAADEVEILATPRPGRAVAHDNGLVLAIDTELDDELRAEGDARELSRAIQDLRKQAKLELDDSIDLWLAGPTDLLDNLEPHLDRVAEDVLADSVSRTEAPADAEHSNLPLGSGEIAIGLRRRGSTS